MAKQSKKPADLNRLAAAIVDEATEQIQVEKRPLDPRNPHAVALGRLGGQKGGKARAKALTRERRAEIGKKAADKRWTKRAQDE